MSAAATQEAGRFTTGSIMRHVVVMAFTGSVGLVSIFAVDLLSLLYISWLGNINFTAAVGYATAVMFFSTSANVGLMIGMTALVSRALGAKERDRARRFAGTGAMTNTIVAGLIGLGMMLGMTQILKSLGADGETLDVAWRFLMIAMPSNILLGLGMAYSGVLRSVGDARRAMFVTLSGGIVSIFVDPLLIFGFGLGVDGAAWGTNVSRLVFALVGFHGAVRIHKMVKWPKSLDVMNDFNALFAIAMPAVLTNLAGPAANAYMTSVLAPFGEEAVAANAIITRLVPVAFGTVFALSAAVGPIFGQNLGARNIKRVRRTLTDALIFSAVSVLIAWAILALLHNEISYIFHATGEAKELVSFFCLVITGTWIFHGALFVANASFNNLGAPMLATVFNWGKSTIGTIPFAIVGAEMGGAKGALIGQGIGAIAFGVVGVVAAYRVIDRVARRWDKPEPEGQKQ